MPVNTQDTRKALLQVEGDDHPSHPQDRNIYTEADKASLPKDPKSSKTLPKRIDDPIKQLESPTGDAHHLNILIPFRETKLLNPLRPAKSSYIPSSRMMFYVVHIMDTLLVRTKQFIENAGLYHPYITRLYYAEIFVIQTLRCMKEANVITDDQRDFLEKFLEQFPPQRLPIAGPLVALFQSISVSQPSVERLGVVYPKLPSEKLFHQRKAIPKVSTTPLKRKTGESDEDLAARRQAKALQEAEAHRLANSPSMVHANWLIPNIPGIISFINRLLTQEIQDMSATNRYPARFGPLLPQTNAQGAQIAPELNGYAWPSVFTEYSDDFKWYLTTPGLEYPLESTKQINENFTNGGDALRIPSFIATDRFGEIRKYTGLRNFEWFSNILPIVTDQCSYFRSSSTLVNCPPTASASGQVIIKYLNPETPLQAPKALGDTDALLQFAFKAETVSTHLSNLDQLQAYYSQTNVLYPSSHPYTPDLSSVDPDPRVSGPYWESSTIKYHTLEDSSYLLLQKVIKEEFHLTRIPN